MRTCTHPPFRVLVFVSIYAVASAMTCVSPASNARLSDVRMSAWKYKKSRDSARACQVITKQVLPVALYRPSVGGSQTGAEDNYAYGQTATNGDGNNYGAHFQVNREGVGRRVDSLTPSNRFPNLRRDWRLFLLFLL